MSSTAPDSPRSAREPAVMSAAEKLMAEWEARHDVAARGRRVDPAAALQHYLSHSRCDEGGRHPDRPARSAHPHGRAADRFAAEHPLTASLLRWGEDPR
ncbi:hypothetical protein GCU56_21425 [Geodermatophilus sabuli]|uniref:Uncharacterized protein n=1 Tax=Geodermatophilus sabuli TaxID=1564158 RepID=A0A7K3W6H5_9ACTN|nr:hypothetical protein [Geodermatophilus sabuli]NEK60422.1 hypothetical protein [Geodermatophilus sabuli]